MRIVALESGICETVVRNFEPTGSPDAIYASTTDLSISFFCFAYSGNFVAGAQKDQIGLTRVQMGINPVQFRYTLAAGEAFFAPQPPF